MEQHPYVSILRRAGTVLIAIGVLDIAVMIYCIVNGISYSSSLNVFAVVAGFFLLRGSLAVAGLVRWFSVFFLSALCALAFVWPVVQPVDLTLTQVRLSPFAAAVSALLLVALVCLFAWLQRQLGRPPVLVATKAAGKKIRSMWVPAAAGLALVALLAVVVPLALGGESGSKAKAVAQGQLGAGYKYHVSSLSVSTTSRGTSVSARVTAWSDKEVRIVPVEWSE
jgi:hypothetical protein